MIDSEISTPGPRSVVRPAVPDKNMIAFHTRGWGGRQPTSRIKTSQTKRRHVRSRRKLCRLNPPCACMHPSKIVSPLLAAADRPAVTFPPSPHARRQHMDSAGSIRISGSQILPGDIHRLARQSLKWCAACALSDVATVGVLSAVCTREPGR